MDVISFEGTTEIETVCLFCLGQLTLPFNSTALENAVPYASDLMIRLDDPTKNKSAFNLLCTLLGIDFRKEKSKRFTFERGQCLPLCLKCQNLYQEIFQLHVQVMELDRLMKERVQVIVKLICDSDFKHGNNGVNCVTQLTAQGLDILREKVIKINTRKTLKESRKSQRIRKTRSSISSAGNLPAGSIFEQSTTIQIKTEPVNHESVEASHTFDIEGEADIPWDDEMDFEESFDSLIADAPLNEGQISNKEPPTLRERKDREPVEIPSSFVDEDFQAESDNDSSAESDPPFSKKSPQKRKRGRPKRNCNLVRRQGAKSANTIIDYTLLTCHICSEQMKGRSSFDLHYAEKHPEEQKYTCIYCKKHFTRLRGILVHQQNHLKMERLFGCEICGKHFVTEMIKKRHIKRIHLERQQTTILEDDAQSLVAHECHLCNEVINGLKSFKEHYRDKHPDEKRYSCKYCKRLFLRAREALSHQRSKHEKLRLDSDKGDDVSGSEVIVSILDPQTGEVKENRKYRKRGRTTGARTEADYTCHLCDQVIIGSLPLKKHYKEVHPEEKRYTCKFCQKHFLRLREVEGHQRKHTGERPYQCEKCDRRFVSRKLQQHHEKIHHNPNAKLFKCEKCGKSFASESVLNYHRESHNETVVICLTCGGSYISKIAFQSHNKKMHEGTAKCSDPIRDPSDEQLESLGVQFRGKLKCFLCWNFIPGTRNVQRHFDDHHAGTNPYKCPHCGKSAKIYKDMFKHVYRHLGNKNLQCDKCPRRFFTSGELNNHSKVHMPDGEKFKHVCDTCGASFASKHSLQQHSKKHDPDGTSYKWICEICGRSYSDKKGYTQHKKSAHSTDPEHKCPHCPRAFGLLWELRKHINKHAAQKPYKCPQCDMRFSYTTSRRRHVKEIHQKIKVRRHTTATSSKRKKQSTSLVTPTVNNGDQASTTVNTNQIIVEKPVAIPKVEPEAMNIYSDVGNNQWGNHGVLTSETSTSISILTFKQTGGLDFQELK